MEISDNTFKTTTNTFYFTYKNLYNYSKFLSLSVLKNNSNIKNYGNLGENKKVFYEKLLEKENTFTLGGVLSKTYVNWDKFNNKSQVYNFIKDTFTNNLKDIIFEVLISLGMLNEFVLNPKITDKSYSGNNDFNKYVASELYKKYVKHKQTKEEYLNTYYYLTGKKYNELDLYSNEGKKTDFLEYMFNPNAFAWYNSFALTWSSQICFFTRYQYSRIMLITGATGQGKSVIVPIMLYYASRMLDLTHNSKVISTQPTMQPTINNAITMSKNLAVPILINGKKTMNGYFQFSTSKNKHLVSSNKTFIKEVTDRTLLQELLKNPYMKLRTKIKNNKFKYLNDNVYDIIIIDEAHMHNTSMDIIMTLIKSTLFLNNKIKFVITSATMDKDEYIYRRFYSIIDNNFIYPLSFNNMIDKNIIDMRYHISPPGETTRFTVNDYYYESDTKDYEEAEKIGLINLNKILSTSTDGHILFFTTTNSNIDNLVKNINKTTNKNVIALPLSSRLRNSKEKNWFDLIEKVNSNFDKIIYKKEDILDVINLGSEGFETVPKNTYNRAVIVSTNVVEASVTIDNLKYVIDTGYQNSVSYDAISSSMIVKIDKITEASRVQRRGRVGRSSSGFVYYSYKKGSRENVETRYDMTTKDITFDLLNILSKGDSPKLFDIKYHPYVFYMNNRKITKTFDDFISQETNNDIIDMYKNMFESTYDLETIDFLESTHKYKSFFIKDETIKNFKTPRLNGYSITDIYDKDGLFYIIHPGENYFKRNVMTGVILYDYDKTTINNLQKELHIEKIKSSMKNLILSKYIREDLNNEKEVIIYKFEYTDIIDELLDKYSEYFSSFSKSISELELKFIAKTLLISFNFDNYDTCSKVLSLMYSIESIRSLIYKTDPRIIDYNSFNNKWLDNTSQLFMFEKIMDNFQDLMIKPELFKKETKVNEELKKKKTKFENAYKKHGNKIFVDKKLLSFISDKEIESFVNAKNMNKNYEDFIETTKINNDKEKIDDLNLEKKCKLLCLDSEKIKMAVNTYNKIIMLKQKIIDKNYHIKIENEYPVIKTGNEKDDLILTFLESFLMKVYKKNERFLTNVFSSQKLDIPKNIGFNYYDSLFMIIKHDSKNHIGISRVTLDLINRVIPIDYINKNEAIVETVNDANIMSVTRKIYSSNDFTKLASYIKSYYKNRIL